MLLGTLCFLMAKYIDIEFFLALILNCEQQEFTIVNIQYATTETHGWLGGSTTPSNIYWEYHHA